MSPPIKTLSGNSRSFIAVPSARNSGLDKTSKVTGSELFLPLDDSDASRICLITSAVLTGNVLFSTTMVWPLENFATSLAHA